MMTIRQAVQAYYYSCIRNRKDINPMRIAAMVKWIQTRQAEGMDISEIIYLK